MNLIRIFIVSASKIGVLLEISLKVTNLRTWEQDAIVEQQRDSVQN